jgi:hypothetical protein
MRRVIAVTCVLVFGLLNAVQAQDAANPTGTWKWSVAGRRGGQPREQTLKLKLEADKLTGTILTGGQNAQETPITDATFKDGTVTFKVTRQFGDNQRTTTYTGKLEGDTIKGKYSTEIQGETREQDWEAKRDKAAAA